MDGTLDLVAELCLPWPLGTNGILETIVPYWDIDVLTLEDPKSMQVLELPPGTREKRTCIALSMRPKDTFLYYFLKKRLFRPCVLPATARAAWFASHSLTLLYFAKCVHIHSPIYGCRAIDYADLDRNIELRFGKANDSGKCECHLQEQKHADAVVRREQLVRVGDEWRNHNEPGDLMPAISGRKTTLDELLSYKFPAHRIGAASNLQPPKCARRQYVMGKKNKNQHDNASPDLITINLPEMMLGFFGTIQVWMWNGLPHFFYQNECGILQSYEDHQQSRISFQYGFVHQPYDLPASERVLGTGDFGQLHIVEWWIQGRMSREQNRARIPHAVLSGSACRLFSRTPSYDSFLSLPKTYRTALITAIRQNCVADGCCRVRYDYNEEEDDGRIEFAEWRREGRLERDDDGPVYIHHPYNSMSANLYWRNPDQCVRIEESSGEPLHYTENINDYFPLGGLLKPWQIHKQHIRTDIFAFEL